MIPYLIQRAKFEDRDWKSGIDSIVNLDYMGSAEFEWGAVPKSLCRIREGINNYTYLDIPIQGKVITVFCKDSQKTEMKTLLEKLAKREFILKELSDFNSYINPSSYDLEWTGKHGHKTDFWWDISHDFMFWKKNPDFEVKFKKQILPK